MIETLKALSPGGSDRPHFKSLSC